MTQHMRLTPASETLHLVVADLSFDTGLGARPASSDCLTVAKWVAERPANESPTAIATIAKGGDDMPCGQCRSARSGAAVNPTRATATHLGDLVASRGGDGGVMDSQALAGCASLVSERCREMAPDALTLLLSWLDPDRERSGQEYERVRERLIRLFHWRGAHIPEDLADRTLDRVAMKVAAGLQVEGSKLSYVYGVARKVLLEHFRDRSRARTEQQLPPPEPIDEQAILVLEECLRGLTPAERELILSYSYLKGSGSTTTTVTRSERDALNGEFGTVHEATTEGATFWRETRQAFSHTNNSKAQWFLRPLAWRQVEDARGILQHTRFSFDEYGRKTSERRRKDPSADGNTDVKILYGWGSSSSGTAHEQGCQTWCLGDESIPCPSACDGGSNCNSGYTMLITHDKGAVSSRRWRGVTGSWKSEDTPRTATGSVELERDPIEVYYKRYERDKVERLTKIDFSDQADVTLTWATAVSVSFTRVSACLDDPGGSVKYDAYGRRRQVSVQARDPRPPVGNKEFVKNSAYDAIGNLIWDADWSTNATSTSGIDLTDYDPFGRVGKLKRGATEQRSYSYDGLKETETYYVQGPSNETTQTRTRVYDGLGRLIQVLELGQPGRTTTYEYDGLDRLRHVEMTAGTASQERRFTSPSKVPTAPPAGHWLRVLAS